MPHHPPPTILPVSQCHRDMTLTAFDSEEEPFCNYCHGRVCFSFRVEVCRNISYLPTKVVYQSCHQQVDLYATDFTNQAICFGVKSGKRRGLPFRSFYFDRHLPPNKQFHAWRRLPMSVWFTTAPFRLFILHLDMAHQTTPMHLKLPAFSICAVRLVITRAA